MIFNNNNTIRYHLNPLDHVMLQMLNDAKSMPRLSAEKWDALFQTSFPFYLRYIPYTLQTSILVVS